MWGKALQSQTVVQITTNISYLIGKIHKHSQNADEGAGSCPATWKRGPAWQRGAVWALLLSHGAVICFCHKATLSVELRLRGDNSIFGAGMAGKTQLQLVALALSPQAIYSPRRDKKILTEKASNRITQKLRAAEQRKSEPAAHDHVVGVAAAAPRFENPHLHTRASLAYGINCRGRGEGRGQSTAVSAQESNCTLVVSAKEADCAVAPYNGRKETF